MVDNIGGLTPHE